MIIRLLFDTEGQDLVEYSLLLGAIALAGAATVVGMGATIDRIWEIVNGRITTASE